MPHDMPLIATITIGFGFAFLFGAIASRLRLSPLIGYILAGIAIGPHTPGFVGDVALARELSEIGIMLLMFGVGLHFSLKDLIAVRHIAIPGALAQIAGAAGLGFALAYALDWPVGGGMIFGLALSVASTVVLSRALQERRLLGQERGRIAMGWLIVEDLAMVLAPVLLPTLAGGENTLTGSGALGLALLAFGKIAAFVAFMLLIGRRAIPWLLHSVAHTGSRELFRLAVLAIALGVAFAAAQLFGVSLALGAFFAGMVMSESELSQQAAEETLPFRDAFAVLFFVSVGMLFDPANLMKEAGPLAATIFIIVIGKSFAAYAIIRLFRRSHGTALLVAVSLAQIGEFSFILAELGVGLDLLPALGRDLILAGALVSILVNPLLFRLIDNLASEPADEKAAKPASAPIDRGPEAGERTKVILIGYGRVGRRVADFLAADKRPFLVIEDAERPIADLSEAGRAFLAGNAASPEILAAAGLPESSTLIVAIPNAFEAGQIVEQARRLHPGLTIIARAHSDAAIQHLTTLGADHIIMGEREIADGIIRRLGAPGPDQGKRERRSIS